LIQFKNRHKTLSEDIDSTKSQTNIRGCKGRPGKSELLYVKNLTSVSVKVLAQEQTHQWRIFSVFKVFSEHLEKPRKIFLNNSLMISANN